MSNTWDGNNDEDLNEGGKPSGLRAHAKQLEADKKALEEKLAVLEKTVRTSTVTKALESKGLNPLIAGLVPADIEATEEAVSKWVEQYGGLFSPTAPPATETPAAPQETPEDRAAFDEFQEQTDRMNKATGAATIPGSGEAELVARIQAAKTKAELDAVMRSAGPVGRG